MKEIFLGNVWDGFCGKGAIIDSIMNSSYVAGANTDNIMYYIYNNIYASDKYSFFFFLMVIMYIILRILNLVRYLCYFL